MKTAWTPWAAWQLEVFAVDVAHPEIGIPVVYVLIPGTHFLDRTRNTNVVFHLAKTAALYAEPLEALAALQRLNEAFPERFEVHFFLGLALANLGDERRRPGPFSEDPEPESPGPRSPQHLRAPGQLPQGPGRLPEPRPRPSVRPWNWTRT